MLPVQLEMQHQQKTATLKCNFSCRTYITIVKWKKQTPSTECVPSVHLMNPITAWNLEMQFSCLSCPVTLSLVSCHSDFTSTDITIAKWRNEQQIYMGMQSLMSALLSCEKCTNCSNVDSLVIDCFHVLILPQSVVKKLVTEACDVCSVPFRGHSTF